MGANTTADPLSPKVLDRLLEKFQGNAYPSMIDDLGLHLGVSGDSVRRLAVGWAPIVPFVDRKAGKPKQSYQGWWAIPERDDTAKLLGLSLRSQNDQKVMYPGSKHGLVYEVNPDHSGAENGYTAGAHNWVRTMDAGILCPVCQKPDGCLLSAECPADPKAAVCIRTSAGSVKQLRMGYLHIRKPEGVLKGASALPPSDYPVVVVEGFSDTAAAMGLGLVAVGRPSNLACLDMLSDLVRGRRVIIVGENDRKPDGKEPGKEGMAAAFNAVRKTCAEARMVMPPEHVKDFRAWVVKYGLTRDEFLAFTEKHAIEPDELPVAMRGGTRVEAVLQAVEGDQLSHDVNNVVYATYPSSTALGSDVVWRRETVPVESDKYGWHLRFAAYSVGQALSETALKDIKGQQAAKGMFLGALRPVFLRHAFHEGCVYIDLCNALGECVEISPGGVRVIADPPVLFRRTPGMLELPRPDDCGDFSAFFDLIGLTNPDHRITVLSWLVGAHHPAGPYPLLNLAAQQGSGKSLLAEFLVGLLDPSEIPLMALIESESDLAVVGRNQRVLAFDNVSSLSPAISDVLCRIVTKAGSKGRKFYSQDETVSFRGGLPIIVTSIGDVLNRPDLRQRSVVLALPPIADEARKTEESMRGEFLRIRPQLLAALYRAVSVGLKNLPNVRLPRVPRMADFASFVVAAEPALPWAHGDFLRVYSEDQQAASEAALEDSAVGPAVLKLMRGRRDWTGAMGDLLAEVDRLSEPSIRCRFDFPKSPRSMGNAIERIRPALAAAGIVVEKPPRRNDARQIHLKRVSA